MVEVFKTNVEDCEQANRIVDRIRETFAGYIANFDLEDCDSILRIQSMDAPLESQCIINMMQELGFDAEILEDTIIPVKRLQYA